MNIEETEAIELFKVEMLRQGLLIEDIESYEFFTSTELFEGKSVLKVCTKRPAGADTMMGMACARLDETGVVDFERFW